MANVYEEVKILFKSDPEAFITGLGIEITCMSGDRFLCNCPHHASESGTSLVVGSRADDPSEDAFHCFGCGVGGDIPQLIEWVKFTTIQHPPNLHNAMSEFAGENGLTYDTSMLKKLPRHYAAIKAFTEFTHENLVNMEDNLIRRTINGK